MLFSTNIRRDPAARCTVDGSVLPAPDTRTAWYQGAVRHRPDLSGDLEENHVWFSLGSSVSSLICSRSARKSLLVPTGARGMCCLFTFSLFHPSNLPTPPALILTGSAQPFIPLTALLS